MINSDDPYTDQKSGCLINRLGINNIEELSRIEVAASFIRIWELNDKNKIPQTFDLEHLKAIHAHIFGDCYQWAGKIRTVELGKGETQFAPKHIIESGSHYLFNELKKDKYLKDLDLESFSNKAGYYLGEINHLHPFREGNGRTQRVFISQLAEDNDYYITWEKVQREQMLAASIEAHHGRSELLSNIIRDNIIDRSYSLAMAKSVSLLGEETSLSKAIEGKDYDGRIVALTDRYIVQAIQNKGKQTAIIHNRLSLSKELTVGQEASISYPHGKVGLVQGFTKDKESEKEYSKNYLKNRDYER